MTAHHPTQDTPGERLLLIQLAAPRSGSEFRHIHAQVVRRAIPDVRNGDGGISSYYDGGAEKAVGYRWADWSSIRPNAICVKDLVVYGQMDVRHGAVTGRHRDGQPYGNNVRANVYPMLEARDVNLLHDAFTKLERKRAQLIKQGHEFRDSYADACRMFALSLGIKKILVYRKGREGADLSDARAFSELGLDQTRIVVESLVSLAHA